MRNSVEPFPLDARPNSGPAYVWEYGHLATLPSCFTPSILLVTEEQRKIAASLIRSLGVRMTNGHSIPSGAQLFPANLVIAETAADWVERKPERGTMQLSIFSSLDTDRHLSGLYGPRASRYGSTLDASLGGSGGADAQHHRPY